MWSRICTGKSSEDPYGKTFDCKECWVRISRNNQLKCHIQKHTWRKQCICKECWAGFLRSYNPKQHTSLHTGEKTCSCKECGAGFSQGNNLNTHTATHTGEKKLFCTRSVGQYFPEVVIWRDICKHILEQDFISDNQTRRDETHAGEGPFNCSCCFVRLV